MYAGSKLKKLRQELGLNQSQIANDLGLSQPYYSAIEGGKKKITLKVIKKIEQKWGAYQGWFDEIKSKHNSNKMGGKNGGYNGGAGESELNRLRQIELRQVVAEFEKKIDSKEYKTAETIRNQVIIKYTAEIKEVVPVLKELWSTQSKLMLFINQFDKYILPEITEEFYERLKSGETKEGILSAIDKTLAMLQMLPEHIKRITDYLDKAIIELSPLDVENQISRDVKSEMSQIFREFEFEKAAPIRHALDLSKKEFYPNVK